MKKQSDIRSNPLLSPGGPIPFDRIQAHHVEPAIHQLLDDARASIRSLTENTDVATYHNTLEVLENTTERLDTAMSWIGHLEELLGQSDVREAKQAVQGDVAIFRTSLRHNTELWQRLKDARASDQYETLDPTRRRNLDETLKDFDRHGAHLPEASKERLAAIDVALTEVTNRFGQNVVDATDAYAYLITDERELKGLPQSAINAARLAAQQRGVDGWRFTLQAPSLIPVLDHLEDRGIREALYRAYNTRATDGEYNNQDALQRILELRQEKADILGYRDVSDLFLESRMVKNGQSAQSFLDDLRQEAQSAARREHQQLKAFAEQRSDMPEKLAPWDIGFYAERLRQHTFDFDEEQLRPYFELESVLAGLFELLTRLFGLGVEAIECPVWHDDVRCYALTDETNLRRGVFYLDLFPREGKRPGAWMRPLRTSKDPSHGEPHYAVICANFTPPSEAGIARLKHREVETLFHEFGHLLHHLVTTVDVPSMAGTNVAWDFVELPSQIMENWCWERESLDLFARHHETGERIPQQLFEKMSAARTFRAATQMMRQVSLGTVDLKLHREFKSTGETKALDFARQVFQDFSQIDLPSWYGMVASFNHLFSHPVGYAAGYYSYKWAEVLDADAFTRFKTEGIFSREVGLAFKRAILERGNSDDPMTLFVNFMGREPDSRALFVRSGLA